MAYFLDPTRICHERYLSRLLDIARTPEAGPLLGQLLASSDRMLPVLGIGCPEVAAATGVPAFATQPVPAPPEASAVAAMIEAAAAAHVVHLVAVLAKRRPAWLGSEGARGLVAALRARWKCGARAERVRGRGAAAHGSHARLACVRAKAGMYHRGVLPTRIYAHTTYVHACARTHQQHALAARAWPQVAAEDSLPRAQLLEGKRLAKCLLVYVGHCRADVDVLFELFTAMTVGRAALCRCLGCGLLPAAVTAATKAPPPQLEPLEPNSVVLRQLPGS